MKPSHILFGKQNQNVAKLFDFAFCFGIMVLPELFDWEEKSIGLPSLYYVKKHI